METVDNNQDAHVVKTADEVGNRLGVLQRQLMLLVLSLLSVFLLFQIGSYFAEMFRILGYSILIFYIFINSVDWLERILRNRTMAILILYIGLLALTIFSVIVVVPALLYQVSQLISSTVSQLPQLIQQSIKNMAPLEASLHAASIRIKSVDILTSIAAGLPKPDPGILFGRVTDAAMSTMTWLVYLLSTVVLSFYFLLDGRNMKMQIINFFPKHYHLTLMVLSSDIDLSLQMFFRGQIVLGLLFGLFMIAIFLGIGLHYALLLGAFLGVCEIIPVIGPAIGFIPIILTVLCDGLDNVALNRFWQIIVIVMILNLVQWLKDNIVAPRYIGNVIGLHPVMIFIAIMIGARLDGLSGIICSLPVACVINVLVSYLSSRFGPSRSPLEESAILARSSQPAQAGSVAQKSAGSLAENSRELIENSPMNKMEKIHLDIVDEIKERAKLKD